MTSHGEAELVPDAAGLTMELIRRKDGRYISPDMVLETVESLPSMQLRHDDVMICSYPKSGCHWIWEMLRLLLLGEEASKEAQFDKEAYMVELNTREHLDSLESPRVLNNHGYFKDQPSDLVSKKVKVVLVYRNVKDVAVSYYYHHTRDPIYKYKGTFSQYLLRFLDGLVDSGNVFEYLTGWERAVTSNLDLNVHIVSYEDMQESPMQELERLNKFLGTQRDESFLQRVCRETSFAAMKDKKVKVTDFLDANGQPIMYRKGKVGDWQNHFSDTERENIDARVESELGKSKIFNFRDKLNPN